MLELHTIISLYAKYKQGHVSDGQLFHIWSRGEDYLGQFPTWYFDCFRLTKVETSRLLGMSTKEFISFNFVSSRSMELLQLTNRLPEEDYIIRYAVE